MKLFLPVLLLGSALLFSHEASAQARPAPRRVVPPKRASTTATLLKDGITMKDGKILMTDVGITMPVTTTTTLRNGTIVTPTGELTTPDGTKKQIAEGDQVSLTGRLTTRREISDADSLRKLVDYDLKHPGKRKELEKAREKAEKAKEKLDKEKAKAKEKAAKK